MDETNWLDRTQYPFAPHEFQTPDGSMHYVDEGSGPPVLMVHGTPTWSYLYRHLTRELSIDHRVIAPDNLGFGLSAKPQHAPYRPRDHARRLIALIEHLDLRDATLVVHDFGGPIGLAAAIHAPDRFQRLVLFNTWMWSLEGNRATRWMSRVMGGRLGRLLYRRLNLSPRVIIPAAYGDRSKLTRDIHCHYLAPFPTSASRQAPWVLARELIGSSDWYEELWSARDAIRDRPALLLWGMKDPAFADALDRWEGFFTNARAERFPGAGHFVQEEEAGELAPLIRNFLRQTRSLTPDSS